MTRGLVAGWEMLTTIYELSDEKKSFKAIDWPTS